MSLWKEPATETKKNSPSASMITIYRIVDFDNTLLPLHHYFLLLAHPLHWTYLLSCYKAGQISLAALQAELHYLNCFHQAGHDEINTRNLNYYNMYVHNIHKIMSIMR